MIVLTLNSGSSSLKFGLFRADRVTVEPLMTGETDGRELRAEDASGGALPGTPMPADTPEAVMPAIVQLLTNTGLPVPEAIGHRIVHGGPKLLTHCLIDERVLDDLDKASVLSPLHGPAALAIVNQAGAAWPGVPQVACFDTAFHAGMPDVARTLPISRALRRDGIRRYGFHGLSCESVVHRLGAELPERLIIAHLGSGASVTAVRAGRSIDTTMGLTPSGGIVMGTRSGDLDPGVLIYLLREKAFDPAALEALIDHHSGLMGISGLSGDMRTLHAAPPSDLDARLAIEMFCISAAKQIAAMIVALGEADMIVFTGGIGENDKMVRAEICRHLAWTGLLIDETRNRSDDHCIHDPGSRFHVRIVGCQEDEQIARHVESLVTEYARD
jgi:acetate kinase